MKWRVAGVLLLLAGLAGCDGGSSKGARSLTPPPTAVSSVAPTVAPSRSGNPGPIQLAAIQRLDARVGFVTGWTGTGLGLAKTSDGGATWQRVAIPAEQITSLRFIDERVGWAGTLVRQDRGMVLRTEDGGRTWQETLTIRLNGELGYPVRQLQAVDGQRAWALTTVEPCPGACPTELRRTMDGGKTWTRLLRGDIATIRFASASRGWLALLDQAGGVEVKVTSDGGTTWTSGFRPPSRGLQELDAATTQRAWLMTRDTAYCSMSHCLEYQLFRTDDGGVTWSSLGNPKASTAGCSGGFLTGLLFASAGRGWLAINLGAGGAGVGPGGLLRTEDGGKTWRCATTPPNTYLVSAADPRHVWVTSQDRGTNLTTLFASDDGGNTWRALDLGALR
jgi:photosystem II stability/assembly factor-like uncharacterized protein